MSYEAIQAAIYAQINEEYEMVRFTQMAWMRKVAERELSRRGDASRRTESTNYEFRLEYSGAAFLCRWFRIQFVKRGSKTIRVIKSIAIPKDGQYKRAQFKHAEEWELSMIEQIEEVVSKHRVSVKLLMKAHQSLLSAAKSCGEKLDTIQIKDRVEPLTTSIKGYKEKLS
ncbi:conjugative transfer protein MobI(A/C) [Vibrio fluvialis]|uniref:conjugative transfer protein MobI(A/C) n=1 Tax=Vibrio fluvialis TaxID=676 RepID=UPI002573206A|nr:conjugative transfer protein MobI(A/C) [Vibrio fluvialis]BEI26550.1 hypothetical protein KKIDH5335_48820 [Vibrio fluvialis]